MTFLRKALLYFAQSGWRQKRASFAVVNTSWF